MNLLLDTHVLIWSLFLPERLRTETVGSIRDPANNVIFSVASIWEIAIKSGLGRIDFDFPPDQVADLARSSRYRELPVFARAASRVASLPLHHRDPFDRLLIAQAIDENALLLTGDSKLSAYDPHVFMIA